MKVKLLKTSNSIKYKFPYKTYDHASYKIIENKNNSLYQCKKTFLIFKRNQKLKKKLDNFYLTKQYASSRFSSHIDSKIIGKKNKSHYSSIAEIIKKYVKKSPKKILDIGCYDGKLLIELSKKYKKSELSGYDVSEKIKKAFRQNCKFNFVDNLIKLKTKFDLIICVNTFQYVPNLNFLIDNMKRLLSHKGKIFFMNTCLDTFPLSINYGDQYIHIQKNSFKNYLRLNKLDGPIFTSNPLFPRNLIGVLSHSKIKYKTLIPKKVSYYLEYLRKIELKLKNIRTNEINIFGSTINAKFVFEILKKKFDKINFVDENPHKINKRFCGKKIISPLKLKSRSLLIMPYGPTNIKIINKLNNRYNFKYLKL